MILKFIYFIFTYPYVLDIIVNLPLYILSKVDQ